MPGVLLIESMAQASGWLVLGVTRFAGMPFLAAVKEAKLRSFVTPGAALRLQATILHEGSGYAVCRAAIRLDDRTICNSDLTFRLAPFPNAEFRAKLLDVAASISFPMAVDADG
jgi:3-hydroxyacyl-[acyl-carrier-protein] dehydratase